MTGEERASKIEAYGNAYNYLVEGLKKFPREMWHFKSEANPWSIHDIIIHITDSEANSYVRCRRFIAEPGKEVLAYDENQWVKALNYPAQSAEDALELFKLLRRCSYNLIKPLPEAIWSNEVFHPENGTMTFDDWLDAYNQHVPDHVQQMQATYAEWVKQGS
jgi:hypothetical protein